MRTSLHATSRAVAALMAGLILLLVVGGTSPETHDHLCPHHQGDAGDDHCVINAFANGEGYAAPFLLLAPPYFGAVYATVAADAQRSFQAAGCYLPPACGPPTPRFNLS